MSIRLIFATIAYLLLVAITFNVGGLTEHARLMVMISGLNIFSIAFMLHWVYQGLERMGIFALRSLIAAILNIILVLLLVHGPQDSITAMMIVQGSMIVNTIWLYLYYRQEFGPIKFIFDKQEWQKILKTSLVIGVSFFITTIYNTLDTNMMFYILGEGNSQTGQLELAHKFIILGILPAQIIQMAFFPQLIRAVKNPKETGKIISAFFPAMAICGFFAGAFIATFPEELAYLFRAQFANLPALLMIFAGTIMFTYFAILFFTPLMAWGKERLCVIGNLGGLIMNATLNAFLIPKYGMYGAAFATISSELTVMLILGYFFYKHCGKLYFNKLGIWILITVLSVAPAYFIKHYFNMPIVGIIVSIILFIAMNFLFKTITIKQLKSYR